jgi:hypothetical protein
MQSSNLRVGNGWATRDPENRHKPAAAWTPKKRRLAGKVRQSEIAETQKTTENRGVASSILALAIP